MQEKIKELRQLMRMREELQAEIDALQDAIKAEMQAEGVDTLRGNDYKVTWKVYTSTRIDTAALKRDLPDVAERYSKTTESRRFLLS